MEDRTDNGDLLGILSHLLLEHRALKALLREDASGLTRDVLRLTNSPRVREDVQRALHELRAYLQSAQFDEHAVALLSDVLKRSCVLEAVQPL